MGTPGTYRAEVLAVTLVVVIISVITYRRYLSSLSNVPGPFWASFSRLWHLRITLDGNQNEQLALAHEKYGHFVRLANKEVSVSHPDAVKVVLLAPLEKVSVSRVSNFGQLHMPVVKLFSDSGVSAGHDV